MLKQLHHAASVYLAGFALVVSMCLFALPKQIHAQQLVTDVPFDPRSKGPKYAEEIPPLFSWEMLIYLSWPAKPGEPGVPDPTKRIGDPGATVWETYAPVSEIYLPDGSHPEPWGKFNFSDPAFDALLADRATIEKLGPVDSISSIQWIFDSRMIDGQQILGQQSTATSPVDMLVRYGVNVDKSYYDYVVNNPAGYELYNLQGQESARQDPKFSFNFPVDTIEVKTSWIDLRYQTNRERYITAYGAYYDDEHKPVLTVVGLSGIHVISKITPNWFFMTFEQIDNPTKTFKYFLQEKGDPIGPPSTPISDFSRLEYYNQQAQVALKSTKWKYYQLMGWQYDYTEKLAPDGKFQNPLVVANTQIETYFQKTSSCITCHSMANIGPLTNRRLSMWNYGRGGIYGRTGSLTPADFQKIAVEESKLPEGTFKQMDHVWSLRRAQVKTSK